MAVAHDSSSPLKKLCVGLCLLFYTAHLFLRVSGQEFPVKSIYGDSHQTVLQNSVPSNLKFIVRNTMGVYTVNVFLGNSQKITVRLSSNRRLNWFLCKKCYPCYPLEGLPIFDPSQTETYNKISCHNAEYCKSLLTYGCDDDNKCNVTIVYSHKRNLRGTLSRASLRMNTKEKVISKDFIFVCIHEVHGFTQKGTGIISLSRHNHSLPKQLKMQFVSICLPIHHTLGWLTLGNSVSAPRPGSITVPLVNPESNLYRVEISALQVGNGEIILLHPPNNTFTISTIPQSTYVDSDTLHRVIDSILAQVTYPVVSNDQYPLCFLVGEEEYSNIPTINVQFGAYGEFGLYHTNYFSKVSSTVGCITILGFQQESPILGNQAMGGREIIFDLSNNKISFSKNLAC